MKFYNSQVSYFGDFTKQGYRSISFIHVGFRTKLKNWNTFDEV